MKFFGHPIHLMLIHFPAALFPVECGLYGAFYFTTDINFAYSAFYVLLIGVCLGWLAAIFGALDVASISNERYPVLKRAIVHGSIHSVVLITYTVLVYKSYLAYPEMPHGSLAMLCAKAFLVLVLLAGNYKGGNLVLKDKLGMETLD